MYFFTRDHLAAMILPEVNIISNKNSISTHSGLDSAGRCLSKKHFQEYPHSITYQYNSRGFRDQEWPLDCSELSDAVWCIGDSFTAGIGSPLQFIWPQVLSKKLGCRTINISMDGASNDWISRIASKIIKEVNPSTIVILWSYFHRREDPNSKLPNEQRRMHCVNTSDQEDFENFQKCFLNVKNECNLKNIKNIHGTIPGAYNIMSLQQLQESWDGIKNSIWPSRMPVDWYEYCQLPVHIQTEIKERHKVFDNFNLYYQITEFVNSNQVCKVPQLDYARDYHHFDIKTSEYFVKFITDQLIIG